MTQGLLSLDYDNAIFEADLEVDATTGLLVDDSGFETPVLISIWTWGRVPSADEKEAPQKYGWWGDTFSASNIGSRLWTLRRAKNTLATQRQLARVIEDALAWMLEDGIVKKVEVETERLNQDGIAAKISLTRNDGTVWEKIWEIHLNAI